MTNRQTIELEFPEPDIALATLLDPDKNANAFSIQLLDQFESILDQLAARDGVKGLIVQSGVPGVFSVGADLREFVAALDSPPEMINAACRRGQELFARLADSDFVSVAAIDGVCVGGGAELALWCDYRVLTPAAHTSCGFPEVKVGLLPGWGGGARASRIVGLFNAIQMVTAGESLDASAAVAMGLADDLVRNGDLVAAATRLVRSSTVTQDHHANRQRWQGALPIEDAELGFLGATASAYIQQQTKGQYPAPTAALEALLGGAGMELAAACQLEREVFTSLFGTPVNRALLNVFFLRDANKKQTKAIGSGPAGQVTAVSVIGAGIMGQGVAAANLKRGIPVSITDARESSLAQGVQGILQEVAYDKRKRSADATKALEFAPQINATTSDKEIAAADLILEAIVEDIAIKKQLFDRLEPQLDPQAILCSNTSTIPISELAADLLHPERFCGLHFFNPVRRMPLVEVIRGERTTDETIAQVVAYAQALGKSPIVMNDGPGFLVNRLLSPYMSEAVHLLIEGASLKDIDRAALRFGMPMGPFALYDTVGIDTAWHAGKVMATAFPERLRPVDIVENLVAAGRLGQKSGKGFYDYPVDKKGRATASPEVDHLVERHRTDPREISRDEITDRLMLTMLLEATRALQEGIVRNVRDVDLALIFGIGFPPFRGGLFFWADACGPAAIQQRLESYADLGPRFETTEMLQERVRRGDKFYDT